MTLRRRPLLAATAAAALAAPGFVRSQTTGKVRRIGVLAQSNARQRFRPLDTVINHLAAMGYVEDRHYTIDYKFAQHDGDRLPTLAAELVASRADLIITLLNPETLAAKGATRTIPIVMMFGLVPVEIGLVASLARPGGNVTGTVTTSPELAGKQLEFFSKVLPRAARIAFVLTDPDSPGVEIFDRVRERAAVAMGLRAVNYPVHTAEDLKRALDAMEKDLPDGLWIRATGIAMNDPGPAIRFAYRHRLPTHVGNSVTVRLGALMSYSVDFEAIYARTASFVARIMKGANPAELPVELPTKFSLAINLKAAKAIGLTIPQSLLLLADEVFQ